MSLAAFAQGTNEAYAVLNSGTLTFYYNSSIPSDAYGMNTDINNPGWTVDEATAATITTVKFDASFADYLPKSCAYWFFKCKNLTQIVGIENLKTKDVQYFKAMFSDCTALQSVDLSGFNTAKAIDISCMFRRTVFKSLDLSMFNTENVKEFSSMFEGCSTLQSVDLSSFNTKSATSFRCMFIRCSALTTLDLSGFDTQSSPVTVQMFQYCSSLKTIYVGDSWSNATITETGQMFYDCSNLVGGKGSAFASLGDSKTYARIDGGSENPGYFTKSGEPEYVPADSEPYVVIKDGTATFYYNNTKSEDALKLQSSSNYWSEDVRNSVTKVVFDKSFKDYKPTSCENWFRMLINLTEISGMKEYLNTEDVTDMTAMFYFCKQLTNLDLSNFNMAKVTNIRLMFTGCMYLQTIFVGEGWVTSSVTVSYDMFQACDKLYGGKGTAYNKEYLDASYAHIDGGSENPGYLTKSGEPAFIPDEPYVTIKDGTATFYYNNAKPEGAFTVPLFSDQLCDLWPDDAKNTVTKVVFDESFKNYKPTNCIYLFSNFKNLTEISGIGEFLNTENVTSMNSMFAGCESLTTLDLSNFNTANVTDMCQMFRDCYNLHAIFVGEDWNTSVTEYDWMFYCCIKLYGGQGTAYNQDFIDLTYAHIDGGAENPGYFTKSGEPAYTPPVPYVVVNDGTLTFYYNNKKTSDAYELNDTENKPDWGSSAENITKVVFDKSFAEYKPTSCYCWFNGFKNLTSIVGIENLITDQVTSFKGMFQDCPQLQSVDLSGFNTANATDISCMFRRAGCKKIDLSSFNTENVTEFACMFERCSNLEEIDLHTFNTKNAKDFWCMFIECSQLTELNLPGFGTQNNPRTGHMFQDCYSLTTIYIGDSWDNSTVNNDPQMFYGCDNLIGGKGTEYNQHYIDATYARIDGGKDNPGYFTKLGNAPFKKIVAIEVTTSPKTEYTEGDDFSAENGILTLTYNTDETETIDLSEATITGYDNTKVGEQTLKIEYQGMETTLTVTVKIKKALASISVTTSPKTEYTEGDDFSAENGILTLTYNTDETETIDLSEATITGYDNTKVGEQTLKIEYQGMETTLTVTVADKQSTPVSSVSQTTAAKVWSNSRTIFIETVPGSNYTVIDTNGHTIKSSATQSSHEEINISKSGLFVVRINGNTYKLVLF